ncbi:helix-turn-helix domain-containing protein [Aeromicrobium sp. Root495]|uniref:helix-turn-helix domain-containing protein n=1 Tax=Aeromicrobium sp. Root495 TaxID=1736550 RepID=UPI000A9D7CDA|nr:helix-turn-helix domain-containing protein [Aeromicrobium sp. Root495]
MREIAAGPDFTVRVDGTNVIWFGGTREADPEDARLYAAALLAAAEKAERRLQEQRQERKLARAAAIDAGPSEKSWLDERIWHSTSTAAEYAGMSSTTIVKALQSGELTGVQRTRNARWRIHRDELEAWLSGSTSGRVATDSWGRPKKRR